MNPRRGFGFGRTELYFEGAESDVFFRNILEALGFEYSGPQTLPGKSGFEYPFQAVGIRPGNCVLVVAGAISLTRQKLSDDRTPKQRLEAWIRDSLLSMYDVGAVLQEQGLYADLFFVHDVFTKIDAAEDFRAILKEYQLNAGFSQSLSAYPIEILHPDYIYGVARAVDSAFLSFDALSLSDLTQLTNQYSDTSIQYAKNVLEKLRVTQYFNPPTDELILSALAEARPASKALAVGVAEKSNELAHPLSPNTHIKEVDYLDPVAVLEALQEYKYVDYKARYEISEDGKKITHMIHRSPQENWLFKLLRVIRVHELAKGVVDSLRSMGSGS